MPDVLSPVRRDATTDYYEIVQRETSVEILPGMRTRIWGYNGRFPGPTIEAHHGRTTVVTYTNDLDIPTVAHLHGGVTRPESVASLPIPWLQERAAAANTTTPVARRRSGITITAAAARAGISIWGLRACTC
jgi:FtsP/CotA-like multicopper oxidase with cupredoxin domain